MRQPLWRQWLVMSVLGVAPALGCNHASHHCNCESTMPFAGPVVMLPAPAPAPETVAVASATKPDTTVLVSKKSEPPSGTVAVPIVVGRDTGTLELSAADAEAMGVKPGYTPGALFMSPQ